jgi:hypothetical protein
MIVHLACTRISHQFVAAEEEIVAISQRQSRAFIRSLPIEFQESAKLHHMFHVFLDLYDGPHALTNDRGGSFSWLENFFKVISPANRKAWEDSKVHMIRMIIVDEIVQCN